MPVHRHKKDTTTPPSGSTREQTAPAMPNQQTFRQYLRELARSGIRVVLEGVMREELDALIGEGGSKISRCPEIVKANSTPKSLNATVVMNRISPRA